MAYAAIELPFENRVSKSVLLLLSQLKLLEKLLEIRVWSSRSSFSSDEGKYEDM
jgi:hypothetical protein